MTWYVCVSLCENLTLDLYLWYRLANYSYLFIYLFDVKVQPFCDDACFWIAYISPRPSSFVLMVWYFVLGSYTKKKNMKSTIYTHCCIFTICDLIFFYWTRNVPLTAFWRICLLSVFWLHPFIKVSNAAACKMVVWKAHSTWTLKSRRNHICMLYHFHNVPYFLVKLLNNNKIQAGVWFYLLGIYSFPFHLKTRLTDVSQQG